ncbi:hypothetical protein D1610_14165 [Sphingomonas gilva]|uniref:Uncharacterized protein n=1 Tax=Sphingomonas gilva TaxID=2305907 RepID=A0A396RRD1_9SPHN|nr:hypothetical protein D1610_14165 [Sphingomonas gilva]
MADKIKGLITVIAPEPICDACIVERLGLSALHQASHRTRELARSRGFERCQDACGTCGKSGSAIRHRLA